MKGCICAILLLLCGMIHAFYPYTPPQGCLLGDTFYSVGVHTTLSCLRVTCDINGQISFQACPTVACPPAKKIVGWTYSKDNPNQDYPNFPDCCLRPVCEPGYKISQRL